MTKEYLRQLIKEAVQETIKASSTLDPLHDGVSTSTETGKSWFKLITSLESVINNASEFKGQYPSSRHGPTPNVDGAVSELKQIVQLLVKVKPVILGMDSIERKDMSEDHPHGRYAQQAGATPFEPSSI